MRNPKRIRRILKKLKKVWRKNPGLRFGQLLINIGWLKEESRLNDVPTYSDPFHLEDDLLENILDNELKK